MRLSQCETRPWYTRQHVRLTKRYISVLPCGRCRRKSSSDNLPSLASSTTLKDKTCMYSGPTREGCEEAARLRRVNSDREEAEDKSMKHNRPACEPRLPWLWLRLLLVADQTRQDSVEGNAQSKVGIGSPGKDICVINVWGSWSNLMTSIHRRLHLERIDCDTPYFMPCSGTRVCGPFQNSNEAQRRPMPNLSESTGLRAGSSKVDEV